MTRIGREPPRRLTLALAALAACASPTVAWAQNPPPAGTPADTAPRNAVDSSLAGARARAPGPPTRPRGRTHLALPLLRAPGPTRVPGPREAPRGGGGLLRRPDLLPAAAFAGALALAGSAPDLDASARGGLYHGGGGPDRLLHEAGDVMGNAWVDLGAFGAVWAAGEVARSGGTARLGRRALEATLASTAVVALMKIGFGRARPSSGLPPDDFRPGTLDRERYAFPSGHTAHAFALAATLDHELESAWVPWLAYPLAAGVGASRVVGRRHWVTDVVAGAAVGIVTSRVLDRLHGGEGRAGREGVRPLVAAGPSGAARLGVTVPIWP